MKPRETWWCVPALQAGTQDFTENEDTAQAFVETGKDSGSDSDSNKDGDSGRESQAMNSGGFLNI
jgi:hypothetical protein